LSFVSTIDAPSSGSAVSLPAAIVNSSVPRSRASIFRADQSLADLPFDVKSVSLKIAEEYQAS
jgi:hypothetical protein